MSIDPNSRYAARTGTLGIKFAAMPNTHERTVIRAKAAMAPPKTIKRGWRMAIMAAIKKVLSPNSVNNITEIDAVNASRKVPFVFGFGSASDDFSFKPLFTSVTLSTNPCCSTFCGIDNKRLELHTTDNIICIYCLRHICNNCSIIIPIGIKLRRTYGRECENDHKGQCHVPFGRSLQVYIVSGCLPEIWLILWHLCVSLGFAASDAASSATTELFV